MTFCPDDIIRSCTARAQGRTELWKQVLVELAPTTVAEVGVYRGTFAAAILAACPSISMYYMVDPWRHLENWNKPANTDDHTFEAFYREAMHATAEFKDKRQVLRGTTLEVIDRIDDGSLDFAYIDGDHTLRGVVIDLVRVYPKLKAGGWLGGDDFCASIWQHSPANEPTLVFPFALHFAEAVGARFYALPHNQFLLERTAQPSFSLVDLTGAYSNTGLRNQFVSLPRVRYAFRRLRYLASRTLRSLRSPSASSPNR